MIYIILLIGLMCLAFTDYIDIDDSKGIWNFTKSYIFSLYIFVLVIIVGLRYYTGFDYQSYVEIFNKTILGIKVTNVEWGYRVLNKVFVLFSNNSWSLFLFMAFITITIKGYVIKKESEKIFFSLLIMFCLYFLIGDMGQIRSTFAQSIDLLAIYIYIKNRKLSKIIALCLILVATSFHISSICLLLIFVTSIKQFKNRIYIITYVAVAVLGDFLNLDYLGVLGKRYGGLIGNKLYEYTTNTEFVHKIGLSFNVLFDLVMLVCILVIKKRYDMKRNKKFTVLFNLYFIGVLSYLLFNNYFVLAVRFANYFRVSLILLLPMVISKIENKRLRLLIVSVMIGIFSLMFLRVLIANSSIYIPYRINLFRYIIGG